MKPSTSRPILLSQYKPPAYLIDTVHLDVQLHPTKTYVTSKMRVRPNAVAKPGQALELNGELLTLEYVKLSGRRVNASDYKLTDDALILNKPPSKPFTLEIQTTCDPEGNTALSGLYRTRGLYCTQCEAQGFRRITYFLDRPDVLSVFTTRVEGEKSETPVLLANGNLVEQGSVEGTGRHYSLWKDPHPKPSYLFALVGGDLAHVKSKFKTKSGRKVDLRIYVEPGKQDRCDWAMDSLKRSLRWDEVRFGREYDLDIFMIVAVSDFNMGAMENKGLNVFNDKLILATPDTATDVNYAAIESVIAHEYFHNWTGNRVTCRDWFQLCLKEGLTVFRDQEFSADERSRTVQRIADVRTLKAHQFPEDAGPLAHPVRPDRYVEINNFYTATVYEKGAELCRMLQTLFGVDGFRRAMDLYFERHDGQAATVEQFIACFEDACNSDLKQFMRWYQQAGTPELVCELDYDPTAKTADLSFMQVLPSTPNQTNNKPHHIPVRLGLLDRDGADMALDLKSGKLLDGDLIQLQRKRETFRFENVACRPVPSLLRGFSAPVNLVLELTDQELEFLMAHDSDLYNRWQATQTYATRIIVDAVRAARGGRRSNKGTAFAKALALSLRDETLEPAYRAMLIAVPSEQDLARDIATDVDPQAIYNARQKLRRIIGKTLHDDLVRIYKTHTSNEPYSPDADQAGRRMLRNAALSLLVASGDKVEHARLAGHYHRGRNMTDQLAALAILANLNIPEREKAFDHFYRKWNGDHLVIDKWFGLSATSSRANTVAVVEELTNHKLYSIRNPNKVRALIGAFAMANPLRFHSPDGSGYKLVANTVIELDPLNPQIAARLLGAFRSWRGLEPVRRNQARSVLKRIERRKSISRDVLEIITRILN